MEYLFLGREINPLVSVVLHVLQNAHFSAPWCVHGPSCTVWRQLKTFWQHMKYSFRVISSWWTAFTMDRVDICRCSFSLCVLFCRGVTDTETELVALEITLYTDDSAVMLFYAWKCLTKIYMKYIKSIHMYALLYKCIQREVSEPV